MKNKTDLRIIKTNNALFNALLELMKDKTFEEIKVSDVCSKALVNRSTFYAHYNDKYELLIALIDGLKKNLLSDLKTNENDINTKEYFMKMLELLINHIDQKRNIYTAILINNRNGILMNILLDVINKDVSERIKNKSTVSANIPSAIIAKFYLGAIIGIGVEWLENGNKYTKQELLNYFDILIPDKI